MQYELAIKNLLTGSLYNNNNAFNKKLCLWIYPCRRNKHIHNLNSLCCVFLSWQTVRPSDPPIQLFFQLNRESKTCAIFHAIVHMANFWLLLRACISHIHCVWDILLIVKVNTMNISHIAYIIYIYIYICRDMLYLRTCHFEEFVEIEFRLAEGHYVLYYAVIY